MAQKLAFDPLKCTNGGFDVVAKIVGAFSNGFKNEKSECFKRFDIVADETDHHFAKTNVEKTSNAWMRKIQQEWKTLEKDLPDTIYVRVYETRMDLLRAAIVGPSGTPYHDGLFFFDFQFTSKYPNEPPKAYYWSGGLRLNPNLYNNGTICLSLLNTWHGKGCEKWKSAKSTMLQVLVSIQGLVLNAKPFYNEPAYANSTSTYLTQSLAYNENAFVLSCKTMIYSIRTPPKNFEELVVEHFYKHAKNIIMAYRAYFSGTVEIGCAFGAAEHNVTIKSSEKKGLKDLRSKLKKLEQELQKEVVARGIDYELLLAQIASHDDVENTSSNTQVVSHNKVGDASSSNGESLLPQIDQVSHNNVGDANDNAIVKNVEGIINIKEKKAQKSKLKQFCQYVLKLGKKVLPIEN